MNGYTIVFFFLYNFDTVLILIIMYAITFHNAIIILKSLNDAPLWKKEFNFSILTLSIV